MDWDRDLPTWPLAELSRRVIVRPHRWHVQESGTGPCLLLLHGAGASSHSWRDVLPILACNYHVVALDLPGQGFTRLGTRGRCGLDPMAEDIHTLCRDQDWQPDAIIGHSAGAALALRLSGCMKLAGRDAPAVIGINPALGAFDGMAGWLFPMLAKLLANTPMTARLFTLGRNQTARARALIENTGSLLDDQGISYYARLIADRDHVDATLQMMAQWSLDRLLTDLPGLTMPCLFITGDRDKAVPPATADRAASAMRNASVQHLPGFGHLVHEEAPGDIAAMIKAFAAPE